MPDPTRRDGIPHLTTGSRGGGAHRTCDPKTADGPRDVLAPEAVSKPPCDADHDNRPDNDDRDDNRRNDNRHDVTGHDDIRRLTELALTQVPRRALPGILTAACPWSGLLPPAARRAFLDDVEAARGGGAAALDRVLATWRDTSGLFSPADRRR